MKEVMQGIGVGLLLLAFIMFALSPYFLAAAIQHRLHGYAEAVRACDRRLEDKERLLDMIDTIDHRIEERARLSVIRWTIHHSAIEAMLDNGVTADEVRLIERELEKVERELMQ